MLAAEQNFLRRSAQSSKRDSPVAENMDKKSSKTNIVEEVYLTPRAQKRKEPEPKRLPTIESTT